MRSIKFRGKDKNGEWVYGYLIKSHGSTYIIPVYNKSDAVGSLDFIQKNIIKVDPETVGQYIGRTDKHQEKIFEGEKLHSKYRNGSWSGVVKHNEYNGGYHIELLKYDGFVSIDMYGGDIKYIPISTSDLEIIGNIHDSKEG